MTPAIYVDLRRTEKDIEVGDNRVRNLKEFIATMDDAWRPHRLAPRPAAQEFLENVTLDSDREDEEDKAGDAVTLITMHSCKGLEFPHVYVVGLEDGLLPHSRSKVEGTLDEERRLFYVAVTRAMLSLTISHCAGPQEIRSGHAVSSLAIPERTSRRSHRDRRMKNPRNRSS
jgi:DNA helicase-2/ATP-dependent DNA helicase PcrA